jgi:hypothetical protein
VRFHLKRQYNYVQLLLGEIFSYGFPQQILPEKHPMLHWGCLFAKLVLGILGKVKFANIPIRKL